MSCSQLAPILLTLQILDLEVEEKPEDLYQRLVAFVEDNLLQSGDGITHYGKSINEDLRTVSYLRKPCGLNMATPNLSTPPKVGQTVIQH